MQTTGLHHLQKRRAGMAAETPWVKFMDVVAMANGIFGSLTILPQIYQVAATGQTAGISLLTWTLLMVSSAIWFIYAIPHRAWPILISSALSVALDLVLIYMVLVR